MNQQASQAPLAEGARIGDFVIQRPLDHDGQGHRYLARDRGGTCLLHELFPLHVVRRGDEGVEPVDPGDRSALRWWTRSYLDRARQFSAVHHPALASIDASFESAGTAWHASRPATGTMLAEVMQQPRRFDAAAVRRLLIDVLDALIAVHAQGLVHRAIDPRQIWLQADGSALLRGFGSLRGPLRLHAHTVHSVTAAPYAAPEETIPDAPVGAAADVYALAAVAWQLVTGRRDATPPLRAPAVSDWPAGVLETIERAFAADAAQRPTAQDWRDTLGPATARRSVTVAPAAARRSALAPMLAAAAGLAVLGLGAYGWLRPAPQARPVAMAVATPAVPAMPATARNRPRFMPTSLAAEDGGPALDQAALTRISAEAQPDKVAAVDAQIPRANPETEAPVVIATPVPAATPTPLRATTSPAPVLPAAVAAIATSATPPPRTTVPAESTANAGIEVASLQPTAVPALSPEQAAQIEAEERTRARTRQLALERSRCDRHVSELFADRDFTYADIAGFDDVVKLSNGRLQTPPMRTDDGRRVSFLIDRNGCIVRVMR